MYIYVIHWMLNDVCSVRGGAKICRIRINDRLDYEALMLTFYTSERRIQFKNVTFMFVLDVLMTFGYKLANLMSVSEVN